MQCCTAKKTAGQLCFQDLELDEELCADVNAGECCSNKNGALSVGLLCGETCYNRNVQCCQDVQDTPTVWSKCGEQCINPETQVRAAADELAGNPRRPTLLVRCNPVRLIAKLLKLTTAAHNRCFCAMSCPLTVLHTGLERRPNRSVHVW